jgi:flagellar protein FlbD
MIRLTRLNGVEYWLNPHLIESIDSTPDTIILLTSGKRLVVREKPEDIVRLIISYRKEFGPAAQER